MPGQIWPQKCILEYKTPFEIDQKSKKRKHAFFLEMGCAAVGLGVVRIQTNIATAEVRQLMERGQNCL